MATIVGAAGGGNWTANGTWVGGVAPTAADSVQLTAITGNITIDAGAVCRGADLTGYLGVLTHTAGVTLTIGDATAALSNIALAFPTTGWTYTLGDVATSAISFISTSSTQQTVNFGGQTTGNITFNAASNGSWQYTGAHTCGATATVTFTKGTLDLNGQTCSLGAFSSNNTNTRTLTLGAANITLTGVGLTVWNMSVAATGLTLSAASSTITCNASAQTFTGGNGKSYGTLSMTGGGSGVLISNTTMTFVNLTRIGTAIRTANLTVTGNITISGVLTLTGNSNLNRLQVLDSGVGTQFTLTCNGTNAITNCDFQDTAVAGTANWDLSAITGLSGDCGGNSGITFTPAVPQTATFSSGTKVWSDVTIWTSRVPLPQDNVSFAGVTGGTIQNDMPRLGRHVDWTGATGTPQWTLLIAVNMYGSLTLISGMTMNSNQAITFSGRGSFTVTSAGRSFPVNMAVAAPSGTYTMQDAFSCGALTISTGTFNSNNFNCTIDSLSASNSNTRAITMGTSIWSLTSTSTAAANIWTLQTATGLTFSGASSTINITGIATGGSTVFHGGTSNTYGNFKETTAGVTRTLVINGSNTYNNFEFSDISNARTLQLTAGTTQTFTGTFAVSGSAGKLITINSSSAGNAATLSKATGLVSCDYLSIQDSTASGGAAWYAGPDSTSVSGNTGWIFTSVPETDPGGGNFMLLGV